MSFSKKEEENENVESWLDQIEILQQDIIMMRTFVRRREFDVVKARVRSIQERVNYILEEF